MYHNVIKIEIQKDIKVIITLFSLQHIFCIQHTYREKFPLVKPGSCNKSL